jgi:hypothetical protein
MAKTDAGLIEKIKTIVVEHYQADSSPLLLSDLGARLRKAELWPSGGIDGKPQLGMGSRLVTAESHCSGRMTRHSETPPPRNGPVLASEYAFSAWLKRTFHTQGVVLRTDAA